MKIAGVSLAIAVLIAIAISAYNPSPQGLPPVLLDGAGTPFPPGDPETWTSTEIEEGWRRFHKFEMARMHRN